MAHLDLELELQVLRVNLSGIRRDVRDVKAGVMGRQRRAALYYAGETEPHTRCDRLQELLDRIDERLVALELRCCCRALASVPGRSPETIVSLPRVLASPNSAAFPGHA